MYCTNYSITNTDCKGPIGATGAIGATGPAPSGSTGSVVYLSSSGVAAATSTSDLIWDNTNKRLGIGTATPDSPLYISKTQNAPTELKLSNPSTGTGAVSQLSILTNDATGSGGRGGLAVFNSTYTSAGQYRASGTYLYNNGVGGVTVCAEAANSNVYLCAAGTERVRVTSSGNVGIGATNPAYNLEVNGTTNASQYFRATPSTTVAFTAPGTGMTSSSYNYIINGGNDTGNKLVVFVNGSTRTADGGVSNVTVRNDAGSLILGNQSYPTVIFGTTISATSATFSGTLRSNNPAWNLSKYGQANQSGVITYSQTDYSRNVTIVLASGTVQVPVAGFYQFNFHYFIDAGQPGSGATYFRVNGSKVAARNYSSEAQAYRPSHISAVVSLAVNDIITVYSDVILHGNDNCNFSGHLIA